MAEQRRYEDTRMNRLEDDLKEMKTNHKEMQDDITYIKTRIDNGFSTSIKSTENKVAYIDTANTKAHGELKLDIKDLSKKFDKIMWVFGAGALLFVIKDIIQRAL